MSFKFGFEAKLPFFKKAVDVFSKFSARVLLYGDRDIGLLLHAVNVSNTAVAEARFSRSLFCDFILPQKFLIELETGDLAAAVALSGDDDNFVFDHCVCNGIECISIQIRDTLGRRPLIQRKIGFEIVARPYLFDRFQSSLSLSWLAFDHREFQLYWDVLSLRDFVERHRNDDIVFITLVNPEKLTLCTGEQSEDVKNVPGHGGIRDRMTLDFVGEGGRFQGFEDVAVFALREVDALISALHPDYDFHHTHHPPKVILSKLDDGNLYLHCPFDKHGGIEFCFLDG